ncbi:MAG: LicD family protein [Solobacterium sp.]|nr:LicD family protein [Solobacterium sp.]
MTEALTLREVQNAELEILVKFDQFCTENNLHYVLYYGTLLGAARHQGFIPWDDDIDVAMPRPDYDRFLKLYYEDGKSIGDNLYVLSGERDDDFAFAYAKVARLDSEILPESRLYEHEGEGIWIDVFPIDGFPADEAERTAYLEKLGEYRRNIGRSITIPGTVRGKEPVWKAAARIPAVLYARMMGYRKYRDELMKLARSYPYETSEYVGLATWNDNSPALVMKKSEFEKYIRMPFEGHQFPAFEDYNDFCTRRYGANYMELPPESVRQSHYIRAKLK